jgi:hypothetical protein
VDSLQVQSHVTRLSWLCCCLIGLLLCLAPRGVHGVHGSGGSYACSRLQTIISILTIYCTCYTARRPACE